MKIEIVHMYISTVKVNEDIHLKGNEGGEEEGFEEEALEWLKG